MKHEPFSIEDPEDAYETPVDEKTKVHGYQEGITRFELESAYDPATLIATSVQHGIYALITQGGVLLETIKVTTWWDQTFDNMIIRVMGMTE